MARGKGWSPRLCERGTSSIPRSATGGVLHFVIPPVLGVVGGWGRAGSRCGVAGIYEHGSGCSR